MKESLLKEKIHLLEKELNGLSDKISEIDELKKTIGDLQLEIKGLKLFMSRVDPEFKKQFPEIIKKIKS